METEQYSGYVKNASLCLPIEGALVEGLNKHNKIISSCYSDSDGFWSLDDTAKISKIRFQKEGYVTKEISATKNVSKIVRLIENQIIGYTEKLWFLPGEKICFYIHSVSEYTAQLYRNGIKTEKLVDFGIQKPYRQVVPDSYFVAEGLNWVKSIEFQIPDNFRPGLYTLHLQLINQPANEYNLTFLISTKPENYGKESDLLVLASSNTWQAYNIWGGRSRYRNFEDPIITNLTTRLREFIIKYFPEPIKNQVRKIIKSHIVVTQKDHPDAWEFRPLSLKRPHPNCSINQRDVLTPFTSHLAEGEWRLLAWLEQNNFAYDFVSGFELHRDPNILSKYKAVILSTHCEYWSKQMFEQLIKFHQNGGAILNLSGNSIYREVEFDHLGNMHCVSLRFSESVADESALLGVRFDMKGYQTSAPFKVIKPDHWIFNGVDLTAGDTFSESSLNKPFASKNKLSNYDPTKPGINIKNKFKKDGGSGWETDKITKTAPDDVQLLAKGTNPHKGGADMIIREPNDGRGIVFSASSITFGGSLLIDSKSAIIVKNLLKKVLKSERK